MSYDPRTLKEHHPPHHAFLWEGSRAGLQFCTTLTTPIPITLVDSSSLILYPRQKNVLNSHFTDKETEV
jgi:hypothetical protein